MADKETEEWAEESRRIEAERMKAARALAEEKSDKSNLAFLEPKATKVKGWSNDSDVILADGEKVGNRALIFAVAGVVLAFISSMGSVVSSTFNLGMAGVIMEIPGFIGLVCMGIAVIMAIVGISCEVYLKLKKGGKLSPAFWSSFITIILIVMYYVIRWLIIRFS